MKRKKYAAFTIDVESFCDTDCISRSSHAINVDLLDGFDEYLQILDRHQIKGTLFTVGSLATRIPDKLKPHLLNGHRLALHNYEHLPPIQIPVEQFREQLQKSKQTLEELFQVPIEGFRAPFFSMDTQHLQVLRDLGFTYDSSHIRFRKARHTVPLDLSDFKEVRPGIFCNNNFFEFGLSHHKLFGHDYPVSGGGYVRLSNWQFIKTLIKQYLRKQDYYVFYLHPFELSKHKIPIPNDLKSYDRYYLKRGMRNYGKHIEQLINLLKKHNFEFVTFEELTQLLSHKS